MVWKHGGQAESGINSQCAGSEAGRTLCVGVEEEEADEVTGLDPAEPWVHVSHFHQYLSSIHLKGLTRIQSLIQVD